MSNFITLETVLSKDGDALTAVRQGEFYCEKLGGDIPFTALTHDEFKTAKKGCVVFVSSPTGGAMTPDVDDDKLMLQVVIKAVDKDTRSTFTFASAKLFDKLKASGKDINTAEGAVKAMLSPGEIQKFAMAVQEVSGFGPNAVKKDAEAIKNS